MDAQRAMLWQPFNDGEVTVMTRFAVAAIVWLAVVPAIHAAPAVTTAARVAPNFSLKDLNGRVRHLTDYRGKLVIV